MAILNSKEKHGCMKEYINNYLKCKYQYNNIDNINLVLKNGILMDILKQTKGPFGLININKKINNMYLYLNDNIRKKTV